MFHGNIYYVQWLCLFFKYKLLNMNTLTSNNSVFKRVKERNVSEAIEKVEEWRRMFDEGCLD